MMPSLIYSKLINYTIFLEPLNKSLLAEEKRGVLETKRERRDMGQMSFWRL